MHEKTCTKMCNSWSPVGFTNSFYVLFLERHWYWKLPSCKPVRFCQQDFNLLISFWFFAGILNLTVYYQINSVVNLNSYIIWSWVYFTCLLALNKVFPWILEWIYDISSKECFIKQIDWRNFIFAILTLQFGTSLGFAHYLNS